MTESHLTKFNTPFGNFYCDEKADPKIANHLRQYQGHARNELAMLFSFVTKDDVVVDAGAHIGTFSIALASKARKVFAFEPTKVTFEILQKNIKENNCGNVEAFNCALSNKLDRLQVTPGEELGKTSYTKATEDAGEFFEGRALDTVVGDEKVRLIKIDVEGMELQVMEGAEKTIKKDRPLIYFEINNAQLKSHGVTHGQIDTFLKKHGYVFFMNTLPKNSSHETYRLGRLFNLKTLLSSNLVFDVLAVPKEKVQFSYQNGLVVLVQFFSKRAMRIIARLGRSRATSSGKEGRRKTLQG